MNDYASLKEKYRIMERNILILILLPLPFFAFAYLNTTRPIRTIPLPEIPDFLNFILMSVALALLLFQQMNFQRSMRRLKEKGVDFETKISGYIRATISRYMVLAVVGVVATLGLLFFANVGFTISYAIVLIMVSVFKPSPVRIVRLFRLSGEEKDFIYNINRG